MSVLATLDLIKGNWVFEVFPESPSPDFEIGFKENEGPVLHFHNLSFGFKVFANEVLVFQKEYPLPGVKYICTDQVYLTNDRVSLNADDKILFEVWAKNNEQEYKEQTSFTVPRPSPPCHSWVWDDGKWIPPFPEPTNGGPWYWDCDAQNWATLNPISEQGAN